METDPRPERKPSGISWERWIERQISDAMARGEFRIRAVREGG